MGEEDGRRSFVHSTMATRAEGEFFRGVRSLFVAPFFFFFFFFLCFFEKEKREARDVYKRDYWRVDGYRWAHFSAKGLSRKEKKLAPRSHGKGVIMLKRCVCFFRDERLIFFCEWNQGMDVDKFRGMLIIDIPLNS